jgi:hypothetical protein
MERGEAPFSRFEGFVPAIRGEDSDTIRRPNERTGHKTPRETRQIPRWTPAFPALPLRLTGREVFDGSQINHRSRHLFCRFDGVVSVDEPPLSTQASGHEPGCGRD